MLPGNRNFFTRAPLYTQELMPDDDERLLVEAAQRDPSQFAALYERHFERVYAYVVYRVRNRDAADKVFFSAVGLALAAVPHLKAAGWGRLLFITSEAVRIPIARLALSAITRVGIVRFAQELATDLGSHGITVNVLAPGGIRTPLSEQVAAGIAAGGDIDDALRAMGKHNAIGRLGFPEEFAAMAAFLASERASFVTGTVQLVDGGASVKGQPSYGLTVTEKKTVT